ncbi:HlyD family efflux transporter periplasmic adaptor subunit [Nocardioides sp. 616]|uniref:HlyD family efflux transporter periplasmic adaptor subunit n=1 Tax=Nocardioides sp. 616 TaxID=2268090 RepID=UPI000CE39635|nr:HlyD family efflux transporter periplasmic adaptor subunit [Nocardioides sp. 616]
MTWRNRLRLWCGLLLVVGVVAALTLVVNQRSRQAFSSNAQVGAELSTIGSEYGGVVVEQYAEKGDEVELGQELFTISSLSLKRDLSNGLESISTRAYEVDAREGRVTFLAPMAGTLTDLKAERGTFLAAGEMATITAGGTQYVTAQFRLTPEQYGRIRIGGEAQVELPSRSRMPATVSDVSVQTSEGVAVTTVELAVPRLESESLASLNQPGSPVSVTLTLADSGILAGPTDSLVQFLHRVGVR